MKTEIYVNHDLDSLVLADGWFKNVFMDSLTMRAKGIPIEDTARVMSEFFCGHAPKHVFDIVKVAYNVLFTKRTARRTRGRSRYTEICARELGILKSQPWLMATEITPEGQNLLKVSIPHK